MELLVIVLFFVFFIYFQSRLNSLERQIKEIKTAGSLSELKKEVQKAEIVGQSQGEKVVSPGGENVFQGEEMQEWQAVQGESPVLPSVQENLNLFDSDFLGSDLLEMQRRLKNPDLLVCRNVL